MLTLGIVGILFAVIGVIILVTYLLNYIFSNKRNGQKENDDKSESGS